MSYYVDVLNVNILIHKKHEKEIVQLFKDEDEKQRFEWTDFDEVRSFKELMDELGFQVDSKNSADYFIIEEFLIEKLGIEERIFTLLATYIEANCHISFSNSGSSDAWCYLFDGAKIIKQVSSRTWITE